MRDLKLALRTLFRTPFVTAVAICSLALGIGANAAIFSLADQVLFKPLPVPHAEQLVNLSAPGPNSGYQSCGGAGDCNEIFSYPMIKDLARQQTVLTGLAGHIETGVSLAVNGEPLSGDAALVTDAYFSTLGIKPALGRLIGPGDEEPGANLVAVLSYAFWNSHFNADPNVVGKPVTVRGRPLTIIGVAPRGFEGTVFGSRPRVFLPITIRKPLENFDRYENRRTYWVYAFGRLKPGVTREKASSALTAIYQPILAEVEAPLQQGMSDATMAKFKAKTIPVTPGFNGQSQAHREAKTPLAMLFGVTAVVLLIACANIANLLLARGAGRAAEMGTRLALGAGRWQLIRQLLTESVLLAAFGAVLSLGVALATLKGLGTLLPSDAAESLVFTLQPAVLAFAALMAIGTGVLFGLFPALHATRGDLITSIRSGAGQISGHRGAGRFRTALVTVQITLATGLLICAGLFLRSLVNVAKVDLGVQVDDVITFRFSPSRAGYDSTKGAALLVDVERELAQLPGASAVTAGMVPLLAGSNWGTDVYVQGFATGPDIDNNSRYNEVGAGYFKMLGVPLLAGREFTESDVTGSPKVAIVNEKFAEKFHLGRNPLHTFISMSSKDSLNIEIVGLVQNAKYSSVKNEIPPVFYLPWKQDTDPGALSFYVRSNTDAPTQERAINTLLKRLAPTVSVEDLRTMPEQIRDNVFLDRLISILSAVFASLATLLAAVGLYGVLAYTVQQRTREIGVRMALGADAGRVRTLVMRQTGIMIGIGAVLGIALALMAGKALQALLYGLQGHDLFTFLVSLGVLALVAAGATFVPVQRASRVDPVKALRYE